MYDKSSSRGIDRTHRQPGQRSYMIASVAPLNGPRHIGNFLWVDDVNAHTTPDVLLPARRTALASLNPTICWIRLTVRTSISRRRHLAVRASGPPESGGKATISRLSPGPVSDPLLYFHLRSEYGLGYTATPFTSLRFAHRASSLPRAPFGTRAQVNASTSAFTIARGSRRHALCRLQVVSRDASAHAVRHDVWRIVEPGLDQSTEHEHLRDPYSRFTTAIPTEAGGFGFPPASYLTVLQPARRP